MNNYSKLLSKAVHKILLANGKKQAMQAEPGSLDQIPAAKLFTPNARATWILTEVMPDDTDLAFGLCDLGLGSPELGYVRISELESLHQGSRRLLPVERDIWFNGKYPISVYAEASRTTQEITECDVKLKQAQDEINERSALEEASEAA